MDCFSHKDSCRMSLNLEYYISVLKENDFFYNLVLFFFIICPTVELLCIELMDLYTVTSTDTYAIMNYIFYMANSNNCAVLHIFKLLGFFQIPSQ